MKSSINKSQLQRNLLAQSLALVLGMQFSAGLMAQDAEKDKAAAEKKDKVENKEVLELETMVVTGSRIPRAGFDTLEPATVITRDYLDTRGLTNVADALNEIPGFGVGITPEGGQSSFGVGVNFVNRFGLGSQRTLSLVNGRRFVSANAPTIFGPGAPGVQVDLNTIPTQLIDRVENIAIGGAPTYGSDAIAGTVNIILKKHYEGTEARLSYGVTEKGDNNRYNGSVIWGSNFADDRGNFVIAASTDNADGVLATDRERFASGFSTQTNPLAANMALFQPSRLPGTDGRVNTGVPFNTGAADGIPNSVLIRNNRFFTFTFGGLALPTGATNLNAGGALRCFASSGINSGTCLQFATGGNLVPYNPGVNFGNNNAVGGDGANLAETAQLTSDLRRTNVTALGRVEMTDNMTWYFEAIHYQAHSNELVDQSIYNVNLFGGLSAPITFGVAYPLLNAQARTTLTGLGVSTFRVSRASRDLVSNNASSTGTTNSLVMGADGNFALADRDYNWQFSFSTGKSTSDFFQTVLNQQNFVNALNVRLNGAGQVECSPVALPATLLIIPGGGTPVADPNCVPLNLFGENSMTQAARDYVTDQTRARSVLEQQIINVNVGGAPFDTWGGEFAFNVGYERRFEKGAFIPDAFQQAGRGRAVAIIPNAGRFNTQEWFGEFVAPLVNKDWDWVLLKRFDVTGKFRRVDNTVNGVFDAYTYGFQWVPVDGLTVRANRTKSLRAPAITELFTPLSSAFSAFPDPCHAPSVTGGTRPATRQANCAAFYTAYGINGATFLSNAVTATIPVTVSGDPRLGNETANSWTAGVVFEPTFIDNLRLSFDYYNIKIDNQIANLGAADIATGCYDNPSFNAGDVNNANSFCSRIVRDSAGQVTSVRTGYVNGEYINFTGASFEALYRLNALGGKMDFSLSGFRPLSLNSSTNSIVNTNSVGLNGQSDTQVQFSASYNRDKWGLSLQGNYLSGPRLGNPVTVETADILAYSDYWQFNLGGTYKFTDDVTVRASVTNLFDKYAPFPLGGVGVYDILGRRYNVALQWTF
jgi:outer membrane receptor protein involved in Fe transport